MANARGPGIVLGIITARAGSKGIKDKNIRPVAGKPLIAYTIAAALAAEGLDEVIVSTDSSRISEVAVAHGTKVPFMRPRSLAGDRSPTIDAVRHAVGTYEKQTGTAVGIIVVLQPTSPLCTAEDIDQAIAVFQSHPGARSLITYSPVGYLHPNHMYRRNGERMTPLLDIDPQQPRQSFEPYYLRNGAVHISTRDLVMDDHRLIEDHPLGCEMPRERSLDVDSPLDLELAEFLLRRRAGASGSSA